MSTPTRSVRRPYERLKLNVRNQSSRSGTIQAIVLHDTESSDLVGIKDLEGLGSWFNNSAAEASAHVGVDGTGYSAQFVPDAAKAWHVAAYNSATLGIEQIGFATYTELLWNRNKRAQLKKTAKYIAYWSKKYNIPIQNGAVSNGTVTKKGVLLHSELGAIGGGHHDPGTGYPKAAVLRTARYYAKYGWK